MTKVTRMRQLYFQYLFWSLAQSDHLKMPKGINNRFFLLLRRPWRPTVFTLWQIIVLLLDDPTLPLRFRDIQVRHMEAVLLLHPRLDLLVSSPLLKPGHIHVFEREFNSDILTRYVSLGKLNNRLDVARGNETTKSYLRQ